MALSLKQFVQQLEDSGILAGDTLKDFIPPKASPKDVSELARELIRQKKLTKYQAEEVYRGKAKSLVLGNYVLIEKIGAGGMGLVFKAEHRRMHRTVAIKLLPPHMTKDAAAIARFEREVTAAAKLRHSNIVAADDADCANGVHFLVMEMVEGNDLSALVKKNGPFSVEKAVNYVLQAAKGLEFAHHEGVVHRDIKPANLLLDKKGVVKILDMGLARLNGDGNVDTPKQAELTSTGMVMGTVDYMAPEQALNTKMADARADIYALGCSLYYLLTGKATYDGDSLMAKLLAHRDQTIPSLRAVRSEVPEQVEAVFKKMVAKTVQDRYQTMTEVIVELERCTTSPTTSVTIQQSATTTFEDGTFDFLKKPLDEPSILAKSAEKSTSGKSGNSKNMLFQPEITISDILKKITNPKVMAVAAIIALMFSGLFLIWSMKSGTKVKGIIKTQGAELVILKLDLEEIEVLGKGIKLDLVLIPAGKFVMSMLYEGQHEAILTKPFYMGKYEVTQEQWEGVMGNNPSIETKGAKLPVTDVSWEDCQEFIKKLNAKTSGGYRLPTEAEWEYACRAGTTTHYSFGANLSPLDANYDESKIGKPVTVGSYKPNAFGLYDMHGNVLEWCEDWFADFPAGVATDPKGPATGVLRVLHGGHFNENFGGMQIGYRHQGTPPTRSDYIGFRLARTADIEAAVAESAVPKSDPTGVTPAGNLLVSPFSEAKATEVQKASAKSLQKEVEEKVDLGKGIKLDLVLIPAGKFMMGSPASEVGRVNNETQHEVTFTKPFYMGKYEVTQEQYEAVMGNNPSSTKGGKLPVTDVSREDCQEFITKLNAKPDGRYRLPTEAEWEYACRAGTTTSYSFGDKITPQDTNYEDSKIGKPVAVGSYKPNAFGLYDMHGNVWEWCSGDNRVLRGGAFSSDGSVARSSIRAVNPPKRPFDNGFRLARTVDIEFTVVPPVNDQKESATSIVPKSAVEAKINGTTNSIGMEFVEIPTGEFKMGEGGNAVAVTLTRPFLLGKYEVTQEQFKKVMNKEPWVGEQEVQMCASNAASYMDWNEATMFCQRLTEVEHESNLLSRSDSYRLPTEAEWEYACRAGTTTAFSFGDDESKLGDYAWFKGNTVDAAEQYAHKVGLKKPNPWGLHDMHGNVWEWCSDLYAEDLAGGVNPSGPPESFRHVGRSGSWSDLLNDCRSSYRGNGADATKRVSILGFRVARSQRKPLAFETPGFDKWLKEVAAMPAEQQIEVVVKKLQELNPKFDGKFFGPGDLLIKEGVVAGFGIHTRHVTDISPIRAFTHLKQLDCLGATNDGQDGQLSDLAPLKGMELLSLNFSYNQVTDITPLMGMPLVSLSCYYNPISNLSPLRNMPLESIHLEGTKVADLSPLRGMTKLRGIWLGRTKVTDLSVLTGMPLGALWIFETQVTDLTPLRGMSLYSLSIRSSQVTDLSVLKDMPLSELQLDFTPERDTELLRSIKTLNTINSKPAADFWKEVDEKK